MYTNYGVVLSKQSNLFTVLNNRYIRLYVYRTS